MLIDELGYLTLKPEQANAFFRLMDQRYNRVSTIITTNLDLPDWYDAVRQETAGRCVARSPAASLHHHPHRRPVPAQPGSTTDIVGQSTASRYQGNSADDRRAIKLQPSPRAVEAPTCSRYDIASAGPQ